VLRTTTLVGGSGNSLWMRIGILSFRAGARLVELNTIYPVGSGLSTRLGTRNVNRLRAARPNTDNVAPPDLDRLNGL
jgi:hypothetical protein